MGEIELRSPFQSYLYFGVFWSTVPDEHLHGLISVQLP
jgi:hypothetical protein